MSWSIVAMAANQGSTLLVTLILARLDGTRSSGGFVALYAFAQFVSLILLLGGGVTATKFLAEWRLSKPGSARLAYRYLAKRNVILLFSLGSAACLIYSLVFPLQGFSHVFLMLWIMSLQVWLFHSAVLNGLEKFRLVALCALVGAAFWIVGAVCNIVLIFLGSIVQAGMAWFFSRRSAEEVAGRPAEGALTEVKAFLKPVIFTTFLAPVGIYLVYFGISSRPEGSSQIAFFGVAMLLRQIVMVIPQNIYTASVSVLNSLKGAGDVAGFYGQLRTNLWTGLMAVGILGGVLALAGPFVLSLWGPDFRSAYPVLLVLLLSAVLEVVSQNIYQVVQAQGKMLHSLLLISLPWTLVLIAIPWVIFGDGKAMSAAWGFVGAWLVSCLMTIALAKRFALKPS